jgi:hypothetical protein
VGIKNADFIRRPTVVKIIDHDLCDSNARKSPKAGRAAFDLLDVGICNFDWH